MTKTPLRKGCQASNMGKGGYDKTFREDRKHDGCICTGIRFVFTVLFQRGFSKIIDRTCSMWSFDYHHECSRVPGDCPTRGETSVGGSSRCYWIGRGTEISGFKSKRASKNGSHRTEDWGRGIFIATNMGRLSILLKRMTQKHMSSSILRYMPNSETIAGGLAGAIQICSHFIWDAIRNICMGFAKAYRIDDEHYLCLKLA